MADMDVEVVAAMLLLRKRIGQADDPVELSGYLAQVGECVLSRLGFDVTERADVQIHIGTDDHPDRARITLAWPLPPPEAGQPAPEEPS